MPPILADEHIGRTHDMVHARSGKQGAALPSPTLASGGYRKRTALPASVCDLEGHREVRGTSVVGTVRRARSEDSDHACQLVPPATTRWAREIVTAAIAVASLGLGYLLTQQVPDNPAILVQSSEIVSLLFGGLKCGNHYCFSY